MASSSGTTTVRLVVLLVCLTPLEAWSEPHGFTATLTISIHDLYGTPVLGAPLTASASGIGDSVGGGDVSLPAGLFPIDGVWNTGWFGLTWGFAVCAPNELGFAGYYLPSPPLQQLGLVYQCGDASAAGIRLESGTTGPLAYSAATQLGTMPIQARWYPIEHLQDPLLERWVVTGPGLSLEGIGSDVDAFAQLVLPANELPYPSIAVWFSGDPWRTTEVYPFALAPQVAISGFDARAPDGSGAIELITTSLHTQQRGGDPLRVVIVLRLAIQFGEQDFDGDQLVGAADNCRFVANPGQEDADADAVGDVCDNCETTPNTDQSDRGGLGGPTPDGIGDLCQNGDFNGDGTVDIADSTLLRRALAGEEATIAPVMPPP